MDLYSSSAWVGWMDKNLQAYLSATPTMDRGKFTAKQVVEKEESRQNELYKNNSFPNVTGRRILCCVYPHIYNIHEVRCLDAPYILIISFVLPGLSRRLEVLPLFFDTYQERREQSETRPVHACRAHSKIHTFDTVWAQNMRALYFATSWAFSEAFHVLQSLTSHLPMTFLHVGSFLFRHRTKNRLPNIREKPRDRQGYRNGAEDALRKNGGIA